MVLKSLFLKSFEGPQRDVQTFVLKQGPFMSSKLNI